MLPNRIENICKNILFLVFHCKILKKLEKAIVINFCPKYGGETPLFWGSIPHKREVGPKGHL